MSCRDSRLKIILRVLRDTAELTQTQLGNEINVDRNVIGRIEYGGEIYPDVQSDWVRACRGVKMIDWLIERLQVVKEFVVMSDQGYRPYAQMVIFHLMHSATKSMKNAQILSNRSGLHGRR